MPSKKQYPPASRKSVRLSQTQEPEEVPLPETDPEESEDELSEYGHTVKANQTKQSQVQLGEVLPSIEVHSFTQDQDQDQDQNQDQDQDQYHTMASEPATSPEQPTKLQKSNN